MKKYSGKVKDINWDNEWFYLHVGEKKFKIPIINGSLDILIKNTENQEVGIGYLEKNDNIKIQYKKYNNYLKPTFIKINTKYDFNLLSSESDDIEDY